MHSWCSNWKWIYSKMQSFAYIYYFNIIFAHDVCKLRRTVVMLNVSLYQRWHFEHHLGLPTYHENFVSILMLCEENFSAHIKSIVFWLCMMMCLHTYGEVRCYGLHLLIWCKHYRNQSRFAKFIVNSILPPFYWAQCRSIITSVSKNIP